MTVFLDTFVLSFYASLIGMLGMISIKAMELRSGRKSLVSRLADKTNHIVHDYYFRVKKFFSYFNRRSAVALVQWIAYHILSWGRAIYIWIYNKAHSHAPSKKVIDMVRGKGDVNRNGGSSVYLKKISDREEDIG